MNDIKIDDLVIMTCENGAVIAGPWKGTQTFQNEPIVTVGKRTEYFRSVMEITRVLEIETVYRRES
jgi:hypothetical protein